MSTPAHDRIERNTPDSINERIRRATELSIGKTLAGGRAAIDARLHQLDAEWDTERTLETMAATATLTGLALGVSVDRRWLGLSGVVAGFLLLHGIQGWCPPLPVIRALGVRTPAEIDRERYALKAARGDFARLNSDESAQVPGQLLAAASN